MDLLPIQKNLRSLADPSKAKFSQKFFKTGKGEYGEGDVFLGGITTPMLRSITKKYQDLSLKDIQQLLNSKYHEERTAAVAILTGQFQRHPKLEEKIYHLYLKNTKNINNWDLVDISTPHVVGGYLLKNQNKVGILNKLAKSKSLWERRIAIMATYAFIRDNQFTKTIEIAKILLNDKEDLIHKAVGWMLREVGKRNKEVEEKFLKQVYTTMPRTMLRYAIEKFPQDLRQSYLKDTF